MNVTIKLTAAQVKGIKNYLKEVGGIDKPTKKDIDLEIRCIVDNTLYAEAVGDYIRDAEKNLC